MKRFLFVGVFALISVLFLSSCTEKEQEITVQSIAISQPSAELKIGETLNLKATVSPSNATYDGITWTSTKTSVATVSSSGQVSALAEGNTTITAMAGGKTASCSITVIKGYVAVSSISLNKDSIELVEGDTETLTATVSPNDATDKTVSWSSSNDAVATVKDGTITAIKEGEATITAKAGGKTASCKIVVSRGVFFEAIDIGLSVKWATFNVGATKPEEDGIHFAWGETITKSDYSWSTYQWYNGSLNCLTKYNISSPDETVDNKTVLDLSDDVVCSNWGGNWRMPTDAEMTELRTKCSWTWTTMGGKNGYKVTGPNGNSIFLPAAGYHDGTSLRNAVSNGYYWTSSLNLSDPYNAWRVSFVSGNVNRNDISRYYGLSVRPVYGAFITVSSISISPTTVSLEEGNSMALTASVLPNNATDASVHWYSSDNGVVTVSEGNVTAISPGTATITAFSSNGLSATCAIVVVESGPKPVDLGLSVKWAPYNVGATTPYGAGNYYSWGEINTKVFYEQATYKWRDQDTLTKYNTSTSYGPVDNKTVLDLSDDAARSNWGGNWRMPTDAEMTELRTKCSWTWTTMGGKNGYKVTGRNGNSIFLPATGSQNGMIQIPSKAYWSCYWSSSLSTSNPFSAWCLVFSLENVKRDSRNRFLGISIRPVCD